MILGFIGTGKIASSVITGICKSNISYKVLIENVHRLFKNFKKKFKKCSA